MGETCEGLGRCGRRKHWIVFFAVCCQHVQQILIKAGIRVRYDGGWVWWGEEAIGRGHCLQYQLTWPQSGGEDCPQGGGGRGGHCRHHDTLLLGRLLCVGKSCNLVVLECNRSERLHVARMVSFDVLGKVALVAKPLQTGFEEASERLLPCVLPLVGIQF